MSIDRLVYVIFPSVTFAIVYITKVSRQFNRKKICLVSKAVTFVAMAISQSVTTLHYQQSHLVAQCVGRDVWDAIS